MHGSQFGIRRGWAVFVTLSLSACSPDQTHAPDVELATARFEEVFELLDTVRLEQSDSLPIVRISGIDVSSSGVIALSDASEGMVKLFDGNGKLVRIVGRKGRGPGEFQIPFKPVFDAAGHLHVPDFSSRKVSMFDPSGRLLRQVAIDEVNAISSFVALPDGGYLITGSPSGSGRNTVFRVGADGRVRDGFLPLDDLRPEGERDFPMWPSVRRSSAGRRGDTLFVVNTLADSLWTVDLATGEQNSLRLRVPGYVKPYVPERPTSGVSGMMDWVRTYSTAAEIFVGDGLVMIPFVKGTLLQGDSAIYAVRTRNGSWMAVKDGPAVAYVGGDTVLGILDPLGERVYLARYRVRK